MTKLSSAGKSKLNEHSGFLGMATLVCFSFVLGEMLFLTQTSTYNFEFNELYVKSASLGSPCIKRLLLIWDASEKTICELYTVFLYYELAFIN